MSSVWSRNLASQLHLVAGDIDVAASQIDVGVYRRRSVGDGSRNQATAAMTDRLRSAELIQTARTAADECRRIAEKLDRATSSRSALGAQLVLLSDGLAAELATSLDRDRLPGLVSAHGRILAIADVLFAGAPAEAVEETNATRPRRGFRHLGKNEAAAADERRVCFRARSVLRLAVHFRPSGERARAAEEYEGLVGSHYDPHGQIIDALSLLLASVTMRISSIRWGR